MSDICIRPYRPGEEIWVAEAHRRVYAEEYGWGKDFSDYAARVALQFAARPRSTREEIWVAEHNSSLVGCVMLCETGEPDTGMLRLFLVERSERRAGIGSALTHTLITKACSEGYRKLVLYTADPLTDAIRHYTGLGFRETERHSNTTWSTCGKTVEEIRMELSLAAEESPRVDFR